MTLSSGKRKHLSDAYAALVGAETRADKESTLKEFQDLLNAQEKDRPQVTTLEAVYEGAASIALDSGFASSLAG